MVDPDWVNRVYTTQFKEPFYKGGRTRERVPSWTDRILYHCIPSRAGRLQPEPMPAMPDAPDVRTLSFCDRVCVPVVVFTALVGHCQICSAVVGGGTSRAAGCALAHCRVLAVFCALTSECGTLCRRCRAITTSQ